MSRQFQFRRSAMQHFVQQRVLPVLLGIVCALSGLPADAAAPKLPTRPLQDGSIVEPNVLMTLDDTNSMSQTFMDDSSLSVTGSGGISAKDDTDGDNKDDDDNDPDGDDGDDKRNIQHFAYTNNQLYYNSLVSYKPWKDQADYLTDATWGAAFSEDYRTYTRAPTGTTATFNLQNGLTNKITGAMGPAQTRAFFSPIDPSNTTKVYLENAANYYRYRFNTDGSADRCQWTFDNTQNPKWQFRLCLGGSFGGSFTFPSGNANTGAPLTTEKNNFGQWFSYHHTRMKAVKAGASYAFFDLGTDYRVGYNTMWQTIYDPPSGQPAATPPNLGDYPAGLGPTFIPVDLNNGRFEDVTGANNRTNWFNWLLNLNTTHLGTPSRTAMNHVGQYFSRSDALGPYGPEATNAQLRCRQNFDIFVTDGYWNDAFDGSVPYTQLFPPFYEYGNNLVGNADGNYTGAPPQFGPPMGDLTQYADNWANTLADVAMHYWQTDLRTDLGNNVPTSDKDPANWQHVVVFAISVGLFGTIPTNTLLKDITWPSPLPRPNNAERIDDLWHAAVNSRGTFVAASSSQELADGLAEALASIGGRLGSSSNVTINSAQVGTSTRVFQSTYVSGAWTGELGSYPISGGTVDTVADWKASEHVPAPASRNIWFGDHSGSNNGGGKLFQWANLSTNQKDDLEFIFRPTLAQKDPLGLDLVAYLRGDTSKEKSNGGVGISTFRDRIDPTTGQSDVLGDFGNSSPVYVDADGDSTTTNDLTVYVGGNDGMLHAFNAAPLAQGGGTERFAYIPGSDLLPGNPGGLNLRRMGNVAHRFYSHFFIVDGPLAVSTRAQTKTATYTNGRNILVGTLGRGGKTVYALDVTDATSFNASKILWEFSDDDASYPNLGNGLAEPVIAKLNNGKTGVILGNGVLSTGGRSGLYILDVETGAVIKSFDTQKGGTVDAPNGMSTARYWDANADGTADFIYAGDLKGNVWKWNIQDTNAANWDFSVNTSGVPTAIFTATDAGAVQPITAGMAIALDPVTFRRWIFFGTGSYVYMTDPVDKAQQAWYGLRDDGIDTSGEVILRSTLKARTVRVTTDQNTPPKPVRTVVDGVALDSTQLGWFIDLEKTTVASTEGSERIVGRSIFAGSVLLVSSVIPSSDPCAPGGRGYLNFVNPFSGAPTLFYDGNGDGVADKDASGKPIGSVDTGVGMGTLPSVIQNGSGGSVLVVLGGSAGTIASPPGVILGGTGRISWRQVGE